MLVFATACTTTSSGDAGRSSGDDLSYVAGSLPPGFSLNTTVSGPLGKQQGGGPDFDFTLYRLATNAQVGVLVAANPTDAADRGQGDAPADHAGPRGLRGCTSTAGTARAIALSREVEPAQLCAAAREASSSHDLPEPSTALARVPHSPVPGTGSITVPVDTRFVATSYTSPASDDPQRSIVVAAFVASRDVLSVLDFWFSSGPPADPGAPGPERTYHAPAYVEVNTDPTLASQPVPDAITTASYRAGGVLLLVRCVGLSEQERANVLAGVRQASAPSSR